MGSGGNFEAHSAMMRVLAFFWKTAAGILLCLTPVSAVIVIGWVARAMQRSTFKVWARQGGAIQSGQSFHHVMLASRGTAHLAAWPNWILAPRFAPGTDENGDDPGRNGRLAAAVHRMFGSLWVNLKFGLQVLLNTWVLTLPACMLWIGAWWGGWENSFNKGYEQAAVGPAISLVGVAAFLVVMTYVPMAQARQAATGNWRSFYDFRVLRILARQSHWPLVGLAFAFVIAGLIVTGIHIGPLGLGNYLDANRSLAEAKVKQIAGLYHLGACAAVFVLIVLLRLSAARLYAKSVVRALQRGTIAAEVLADTEREVLARFNLLEAAPESDSGVIVRAVKFSGRSLSGLLQTAVLVAVWFAFVAQLFFAQFLNHDWIAWVNLPLVQVPWFHGPG